MLLEMAIGDAYGAGFEYVSRGFALSRNNISEYTQHPRHVGVKAGCYTDDTQMSISVAELMLSSLGEWNEYLVVEKFLEAFKRDPREGYAKGFYKFLSMVNSVDGFLSGIRPNSEKSGAAMRAGVIGLYPNVDEVIEKSRLQARITHNTKLGVQASVVSSLMAHFFKYNLGKKKCLLEYIEDIYFCDWLRSAGKRVGSLGIESISASIFALEKNDSLSSLLRFCIDLGGDTDTVAAISMGAASLCHEMDKDIPICLYKNLENNAFGKDYLIDLDERLNKKFPSQFR
ncbi:ADP-ribosylglycohydrolase family protein [Microbulbifer sp. CNSA002]|uniref:ADP-ribosylglycohydrolase family protein n=1 Tax=Microbulbifer sp. CNSA002 TaxID=3373604 RepID=UPI0039B40696